MPKPYYRKGNTTIYCGDILEIVPKIQKVDTVITSPPYNLGQTPWKPLGHWRPGKISGGGQKWKLGAEAGNGVRYKESQDDMPWSNYVAWQNECLSTLWSILPDTGVIFYNHKPRVIGSKLWTPFELIPPHVTTRQLIIWKRPGGLNYTPTAFVPMCEWVMILAKEKFRLKSRGVSGLGDVWSINFSQNNPHPAAFPVELPKKIIESVTAKCILDPFAGSGSTLLAAKAYGIPAVGVEISKEYCDLAISRLEN